MTHSEMPEKNHHEGCLGNFLEELKCLEVNETFIKKIFIWTVTDNYILLTLAEILIKNIEDLSVLKWFSKTRFLKTS